MATSPQPRNVVAKSLGMLACLVALFIFTSVPLTAGAEEGISGSGQGSAPASAAGVSPQAEGSAVTATTPRATYSPVEQSDGTWLCVVANDTQYKRALDEIEDDVPQGSSVTIRFTESDSFTSPRVSGLAGYHITLTADEGATLTIRLAESLKGGLTLDRVRVNGSYQDEVWCNGFSFETTENTTQYRNDVSASFQNMGSITLDGGSEGTAAASTNLVLNDRA